jgi:hypothetical protein
MTAMPFRYACIALLALALVGCDATTAADVGPLPGQSAPAGATGATGPAGGGTGATGTSGSTGASGATGSTGAPTPAATATPEPTTARTAPPPPPPTPVPAPKIVAVPSSGVRGTNFVFQLTGWPRSANGQDILQTVTTPLGRPVGPAPFTTRPDGTGLTTFNVTTGDPTGLYLIRITVAGSGVAAQTTFQVN